MKTKSIVIAAVQGVQLLDVSGPLDVFAEANIQAKYQAYRLLIASHGPEPVRSSSGVRLIPDLTFSSKDEESIDTLLVAGCPNAEKINENNALTDWLSEQIPKTKRYGSVCTGAFFLAATGLLNGRRVTTHWAHAEQLAEQYPELIVEKDAIYISDGPSRTAAGVTAGLDLALSLVEEDLGNEIAKRVASQLVMFFKRPGGQIQFSRNREAVPAGRSALQELQRWIAANPNLDHTISSLAQRLNLSRRHFSRMFRDEVGITPANWIKEARIEAARRLLEQGNFAPKQIAALCGFANSDTLRRAFVSLVGVTPAEYRKHFSLMKKKE
ncbi:GlxA family transcriptional regulator [Teredinibacter sp. KSP-S5-2]|uniref:GlxA family transcriptional regulator n=1 Tax=Teredinibacter sp. KSP-S5-2 TaxID=3034506 RepID=UPI002934509C|nr:GlxA family transcriptional regulator [Teredinibacter sp. KSP-S5-2]WNO07597.1 GlxA family transcriptional regulator [Teredinibacter sp. KSP-S5-2]